MKKIGIDCSKLNTEKKSGTHRFLIGFLNQLTKNKDYEYTFFFNHFDEDLCDFDFLKKGNIEILNKNYLYTQFFLYTRINNFDFFIFPWQTLPFLSIFSSCKKLSIIHDEGYSFKTKIFTLLTVLLSDKLFSVSKTTQSKLFRKSILITEGVEKEIFHKMPTKELEIERYKLKVPDFFILSLGRIEPRKNIFNNLLAFGIVHKFYPKLKYLIIGEFSIDEDKIYSFIRRNNLPKDSIFFLNYVSDKDLNVYLNSMEFMIFTSFEEGFGLPVLESYSVQKPVVLSNIRQLAELSLSANQLTHAKSPESISEKIIFFLKNKNIFSSRQYKEILDNYSWENSVKSFIMELE